LIDEGQAVALGEDAGGKKQDWASSGRLLAARSWWSALTETLVRELSAYHAKFPLRAGMAREALRSGLKLDAKVFNAAMAHAAAQDIVVEEGATVRLPSHEVRLIPDQQQRVDTLLAQFRRQPYATPSYKDSVTSVGEEVLGVLIARGEMVQVSPEVLFLPETYEKMVARIRTHIAQEGSITLAQVRDMFQTSRKYAQGLLEHLDEIGVTKRVGDERVLK
jgi:selenocysteine-specific elongation factor